MTMFFDGQRVLFAGEPSPDDPAIGDLGQVVAAGHTASHVKWLTGAKTGAFQEVDHLLITAATATSPDVDALAGSLVSFGAKEVFESEGSEGLLARLNDEGNLGNFTAIAEEAMAVVATRIRQDPTIREVLASLSTEDGADFVSLATATLLSDAFGSRE